METPERSLWLNRRTLFVIILMLSAVIDCQFQFWKQPARGDWAIWDYVSQVIARGGVPYRDIVEIKSPLSAYIGAAAIKIAGPFGVRDIIAIRITYVFLAMLTAGFTFLVAHDYIKSLRAGILAALTMLTFDSFALFNNSGVEPKTPMILFGLVVLWAIHNDRPFTAGIFSMLSALSWQPGLMFAGVAGLAFSRYLTNWRSRKLMRLLIGTMIPLVILILYFWICGALRDFYLWTFHYPLTVYAPSEGHTPGHFFWHFIGIVNYGYAGEKGYFFLAAIGLSLVMIREIRAFSQNGLNGFLNRSYEHAVWLATLLYFLFCMVSMQGPADLIPLLPFVAIFFAVFTVFGIDFVTRGNRFIAGLAFSVVTGLLFFLSAADSFRFQVRFPTLKDQEENVREVLSHIEPGDKIFVHGQIDLLILSGKANASKYILLDHGKDSYMKKLEPGGFEGWFERLKAERPKVIGLSRLRRVTHAKEIEQWVREKYERRDGAVISYYLRKD